MLGTACNVSGAGFLLLVLVGEDHLAFQSFSGHFSHLTSDGFGFEGKHQEMSEMSRFFFFFFFLDYLSVAH